MQDIDATSKRTLDSVLERFARIAAVPRGSGKEEKAARLVRDWAEARGWKTRSDAAGNLVVKVPATPGKEASPVVVLQGHLDMVCEKAAGSSHDFDRDPIRIVRDGDWLKADGTTLGADNGIGIALAQDLAEDPAQVHGPLELLFTVQEETGLVGATRLDPSLVTGRILLNIDSEEDGIFTIGCAGAKIMRLERPLARSAVPAGWKAYRLGVSGLRGGHSGMDIDKGRGAATQLAARALGRLAEEGEFRIGTLEAGTAHNAIARDAELAFALPASRALKAEAAFASFAAEAKADYAAVEPDLAFALEPLAQGLAQAAAAADSRAVLDLLLALPHGALKMSADIAGFVETSNNLAVARAGAEGATIVASLRSSSPSSLEGTFAGIAAAARLAGFALSVVQQYPGWKPDPSSPLLELAKRTWKDLHGEEARIQTIHAGLECGVIGERCGGGMDMISVGPDILDPHSPAERLNLPSLARARAFLAALLAELAA